jgi:hypothetical protein
MEIPAFFVIPTNHTHTPTSIYIYIIAGNLEVKLPTVWADEKQRWEEPERKEE